MIKIDLKIENMTEHLQTIYDKLRQCLKFI